jgi:hypothetical protein
MLHLRRVVVAGAVRLAAAIERLKYEHMSTAARRSTDRGKREDRSRRTEIQAVHHAATPGGEDAHRAG